MAGILIIHTGLDAIEHMPLMKRLQEQAETDPNIEVVAGDSKQMWDPNNPVEVKAARSTFDELKGAGYEIFRTDAGGAKTERMKNFDPQAERLIATPPFQRG